MLQALRAENAQRARRIQRLQRAIPAFHASDRLLLELLLEVGATYGDIDSIVELVEQYASLGRCPEVITAVGADRPFPAYIRLVQ